MAPCQIQNYQPTDQPQLVEFLAAMLSELGFAFEADGKDADLRDVPGGYLASGGMFLLAKEAGRLVGTVALRRIADGVIELRRFYVHPGWQGQGIGTRLLQRALAHAQSGRWRRVCLDTTGRSPAALWLFRRHGFVEIERYNDNPRAAIFMEFTLDSPPSPPAGSGARGTCGPPAGP